MNIQTSTGITHAPPVKAFNCKICSRKTVGSFSCEVCGSLVCSDCLDPESLSKTCMVCSGDYTSQEEGNGVNDLIETIPIKFQYAHHKQGTAMLLASEDGSVYAASVDYISTLEELLKEAVALLGDRTDINTQNTVFKAKEAMAYWP